MAMRDKNQEERTKWACEKKTRRESIIGMQDKP
jgi:hypothetical protein